MSSRPFRPLLADLQAFSTNFHLSTAPPPPLDATLPLFPEPKKTTTATTAPGPATRPPNTGTSAPPEQLPTPRTLSRTLSPLEPLDEPLQPPPRLLPWFARNEPKPDISRPYPPMARSHPGRSGRPFTALAARCRASAPPRLRRRRRGGDEGDVGTIVAAAMGMRLWAVEYGAGDWAACFASSSDEDEGG